jgi:hypothetical protein
LRPVAAIAVAIATSALIGACGGDHEPADRQRLVHEVAFGFNEDVAGRSFALQAELNMPVRRFSVPWSAVEPEPGRWTWSRYDAEYRSMRNQGLSPLLLAAGGPCWTAPAGISCSRGGLRGPPDSRYDSDWAEYVRRLTARYPDAVGVEIWNEPNILPYFEPHPDPARFTALLKAAYMAIKDVDPRMPVISGGLFASSRSGGFGIADARFLAAMYAAGARGYMDGIGAHPYPRTEGGSGGAYSVPAMEEELDRLRAVRDLAGDSDTPIWVTEMGVSTASAPGFPPAVSEGTQGADLLAMVRRVREDRDVRVALIHRLIDAPYNPAGGPIGLVESGFGVFRQGGTPKPAACELSHEFRGGLSC